MIRAALGIVFAIFAGACLKSGIVALKKTNLHTLQSYQIGQILSVFTIGLYTLIIAFLYALRLRSISKFAGIIPCATALLGGFLLSALLLLNPRKDLSAEIFIFADTLIIIGNIFAVIILLQLGRSFSVLPEGRRLVTRGTYSIVRHPLYLAEAIATLGLAIIYASLIAFVLVATQFGLQIARTYYEEKILKENFPEYVDYAKKTRRLIPGVY